MTDAPDTTDRSWTGNGSTAVGPVIDVTPEQFLTGWPIGVPNETPLCKGCDRSLRTGEACTVYAYRPAGSRRWHPTRCFCRECAPATIETPTLGTAELLVTSRLGSIQVPTDRSHRAALTEVELLDYSSPAEGWQP